MNLPIFFLQIVQLVLLVQLQIVHHGLRPAFSLNSSSFSHSCPFTGMVWLSKTRRALLHSPKIGSLFLQILLLTFSIMNTFLAKNSLKASHGTPEKEVSPSWKSFSWCTFQPYLVFLHLLSIISIWSSTILWPGNEHLTNVPELCSSDA